MGLIGSCRSCSCPHFRGGTIDSASLFRDDQGWLLVLGPHHAPVKLSDAAVREIATGLRVEGVA